MPNNSEVLDDFRVSTEWIYAKTFSALESDVARGTRRAEKLTFPVRWRRLIRKRIYRGEIPLGVISGWLGSKDRRGPWKSRYFVLFRSVHASQFNLPTQPSVNAEESGEDDSSNDGEEEEDIEPEPLNSQVEEEVSSPLLYNPPHHSHHSSATSLSGIVSGIQSHPLSSSAHTPQPIALTNNPQQTSPIETSPSLLFYLRRSFDDPRVLFPSFFDIQELRKLPKNKIRIFKLSPKTKIEDNLWTHDAPGRFAIKFTGGRKRILNIEERWKQNTGIIKTPS